VAETLTGERLMLKKRGPSEILTFPRDAEDESLDPHVGLVNNPVYYTIYSTSEPGVILGDCVIYNPQHNEIELGVRIIKEFRNAGYGSEATRILSDYCLTTAGYSKVHLKVLLYNGRAIKAYEKAGFRRCGKITIDGIEFIKMERRSP